MKKLTHIIFDFGAVIININYDATIQAFKTLGIKDAENLYSKKIQNKLFEALEEGKISNQNFVNEIKKITDSASENQIIEAWNMMLGTIPDKRIKLLKELSKDYKIILLSNTNSIHIEKIIEDFGERNWILFKKMFYKFYLSHELGMRKPNQEIFIKVLKDNSIEAENAFFIDDSPQHIKTARKLKIKCHHLKNSEEITDLFPDIIQ